MHTLIITPYFNSVKTLHPNSGGVGILVHGLTMALARKGVTVTVISNENAELVNEPNIVVHRVQRSTEGKTLVENILLSDIELLKKAIQVINKIDIVHVHDTFTAISALCLKSIFPTLPIVSTLYDTVQRRSFNHIGYNTIFFSNLQKKIISSSDITIAISKHMHYEIKEIFHLNNEKIRFIPCGIDENGYNIPNYNTKIKSQVIPSNNYILFIGRLVYEKGVQILLNAAPIFLNRDPSLKIVIAGDGPLKQCYENAVNKSTIRESVLFLGPVSGDKKICLLRGARLVVVPSLYEPLGAIALEAGICKTPVIVSDCGGLSEIIVNGVSGLKVPVADYKALAQAIIKLANSSVLRKKFIVNLYKRIHERYNPDKIAKQMMVIYRALIKNKKR